MARIYRIQFYVFSNEGRPMKSISHLFEDYNEEYNGLEAQTVARRVRV